ncbi:MAG: flagellar brake protein [Acidiferrobacterales bacterium]|nr:flagellar brake protein [Acidiferrobacterales bacterium]
MTIEVNLETAVQLQFGTDASKPRYVTKIIGYAEKLSIIVHTPRVENNPIFLKEDQVVTVRFMGANSAYAFISSVKAVFTKPFPHIHIGYPNEFEKSLVRKAERVVTSLDSTLVNLSLEDAVEIDAKIQNISADGALISTVHESFGEVGHELKLMVGIEFNKTKKMIGIHGIIRSIRNGVQEHSGSVLYGIQFNTKAFDKHLMVQGMIYHLLHNS